jgi:hypothetical protein
MIEKNMIAIENKKNIFAYGDSAYDMYEKAPSNIQISYPLNNGVIADIKDMEITIGHLRKTFRSAEILFSDGYWLFPLSQEETFGYWPSSVKAQVRLVWANGVVEGKPIYGVRIEESMSKEEL